MTPKLLSATHAGGYRICLRFADGTEAIVDFERELWGQVFEPLRDPARFREFRVDEGFHAIEWPNGADFAPEFLYERACAAR